MQSRIAVHDALCLRHAPTTDERHAKSLRIRVHSADRDIDFWRRRRNASRWITASIDHTGKLRRWPSSRTSASRLVRDTLVGTYHEVSHPSCASRANRIWHFHMVSITRTPRPAYHSASHLYEHDGKTNISTSIYACYRRYYVRQSQTTGSIPFTIVLPR